MASRSGQIGVRRHREGAFECLYGVPATAQRLQPTGDPGGECWRDSVTVKTLEVHPFYLLPEVEVDADDHESDVDPLEQDFHAYEAAMEEQSETMRALAESLRGVKYKLVFLRPESSGGRAPGRVVHLTVDALAIVKDVKDMVEQELFGGAGLEEQPVVLTLNRAPLPLDAPIHFAGVSNGDTIIVAAELQLDCPGCEDGSFDAAMRHWAFVAD